MTAMEEFENQFGLLSAEITYKINQVPNLSGAEKKNLCNLTEKQIDEAKELLEQMELEVHSMSQSDKQKHTTRVKSFKTELGRLEKDLRKAKLNFRDEAIREELFSLDDPRNSEDQRTRLLDNTEKLERTSRKLEAGYRMAIESEQMGQDIMDNLHRDREKIQRSRDRLKETDAYLGQSSRVLSAMMRRIIQNRFLLFIIGFILLSVIVVTFYFVFRGR